MAEGDAKRKLTAILAADVVGYSRLMERDEVSTLAQIKTLRKELFDPKIDDYHGRIVKLMGDGVLVEFESVVNAVEFAVDVQMAMDKRNIEVPKDRRIEFRVGINLGDVIIDKDDIYGDGVNIAARLQELAEPGGICIPSTVREHVEGKVKIAFDDAGERELKNITRPVHLWRWARAATAPHETRQHLDVSRISGKASIAILPFDNMSGDAEQEYFSDGVTEDIITELSRYPDLLVMARNSTFVYKRQPVDHKRIARELGVQYLVEGSVRRADDRVRITAQLIDAASGNHLWAERYDRTLNDIFVVQDEITTTIVGALGEMLQTVRVRRAERRDPSDVNAYDKTLQASAHFHRLDKANNAAARRLAEEAIALDPTYARAHAILAYSYLFDVTSRWANDLDMVLGCAHEAARRAVALDDRSSYAWVALGVVENWLKHHEQAISCFQRAIELNPNDADTRAHFANVLMFAGRADDALEQLATAMRLNPHYPVMYDQILGRIHFALRRHEEADEAFSRVVVANPSWPWARLCLAATRAALGELEQARMEVAEARKVSPGLTLGHVSLAWPCKNTADLDHLTELLRKAGLPA